MRSSVGQPFFENLRWNAGNVRWNVENRPRLRAGVDKRVDEMCSGVVREWTCIADVIPEIVNALHQDCCNVKEIESGALYWLTRILFSLNENIWKMLMTLIGESTTDDWSPVSIRWYSLSSWPPCDSCLRGYKNLTIHFTYNVALSVWITSHLGRHIQCPDVMISVT